MGNYDYGVIWTNHANERIGERGVSKEDVIETFRKPDRTITDEKNGATEYQKRFGKLRITVIAKQNERKEWLILSAWADPPLTGTIDARQKEEWKKYQNASFWGKIYLTLKKQLGL